MLRHLRLVALFARINLQNDAAYRFDFLLRAFVAVIQLCGELLGLWTIFSNTRSLAGWSAAQVVALLGVFRCMYGLIGMTIAPNMRLIMEDIRGGSLDFVLLRPINSQFLASFRQFIVWRILDVGLGLAMACLGAVLAGGAPAPAQLALFCLLLAAGSAIVYSFWLVLATSVFWFTRINNIEMVFWNVFEAGRYPIDIYRPWVRWLLTYFLPLALLTTAPAGALVGRTTSDAVLAALVLAPLTLLVASLFWRVGLRRYSGASA